MEIVNWGIDFNKQHTWGHNIDLFGLQTRHELISHDMIFFSNFHNA